MTDHEHPSENDRDAGTAALHASLHHTRHDDLSEDTAQTLGMRRYEAISGKRNGSRKIWMGKTVVEPGLISVDHHHGEAESSPVVRLNSGTPPSDGNLTTCSGR